MSSSGHYIRFKKGVNSGQIQPTEVKVRNITREEKFVFWLKILHSWKMSNDCKQGLDANGKITNFSYSFIYLQIQGVYEEIEYSRYMPCAN